MPERVVGEYINRCIRDLECPNRTQDSLHISTLYEAMLGNVIGTLLSFT